MQIGLPTRPGRYRLAPLEDRCAERHVVMIEGWLRPSCGHRFPIIIRDISIAGFSCEAVTSMAKGSLCWLSMPGLQGQQSEIVWNTGHMVGCAFANLMSQVVLDHILARHKA